MIEIAKILKPQGIKGEVKALPSTNVLAVFKYIKSAFVGENNLDIENISLRQGFLYIKFKGINSRNDAENLRDKKVLIDKNILEESKDDDDFLIDDLIGMVIYDTKGDLVGQILDIVNYGSCDIFVLERDGRKYQAPYVEDVFFRQGDKLVADSEKIKEVLL